MESVEQNVLHSYGMDFGGGGFALSYQLAKGLEKMQDSCLDRYLYLYGNDARIHACLADLGVRKCRLCYISIETEEYTSIYLHCKERLG